MIYQTIQDSSWTYQQVDVNDLRRGAPYYLANPVENAHRESAKWVGISETPQGPVWTCFPSWELDNVHVKPDTYRINQAIEFEHGNTRLWCVVRVSIYLSGDADVVAVSVRKDGSLGSTMMRFNTVRPNASRKFYRASTAF